MTEDHMRITIRVVVAIAIASIAFAAQADVALAESFGVSPAGNVTIGGPVTFTSEEGSIACNLTFLGTLTRSLVSTAAGTQFGSLTEARFECEGGVTIRPLLPATLNVARLLFDPERLTGILFLIERIGLLIEQLLLIRQCLFGPTAPMLIEVRSGLSGSIRPLSTPSFRLQQRLNLGTCPVAASMAGTLRMSPTQEVIYLR
jgi:hypothetical protein